MRTFGIWVAGLIASAIFGGLISSQAFPTTEVAGMFGILGGLLVFTCLRLWLAAPRRE